MISVIGVGSLKLGAGLLLAALIVYFAFRDRVATVVLVLLVVLSPLIGIFIATLAAYASCALFEDQIGTSHEESNIAGGSRLRLGLCGGRNGAILPYHS
jgi:hypothetical protein